MKPAKSTLLAAVLALGPSAWAAGTLPLPPVPAVGHAAAGAAQPAAAPAKKTHPRKRRAYPHAALAPDWHNLPPPRLLAASLPPPPGALSATMPQFTAAALPFRFEGVMQDDKGTFYYLSDNSHIYAVKPGDTIDGTWRLARAKDTTLYLKQGASGPEQTLTMGATH